MNKTALYSISIIVVLLLAIICFGYYNKQSQSEDKLYVIAGPESFDDFNDIGNSGSQKWVYSLYNQSAANLLYNIENRLNEDDYAGNEVAFFRFALSSVIKKDKNSDKVYKKIKEDILGDNKVLRIVLLEILSETPTKESLSILISLTDSNKLEDEDKNILYRAIVDMPDHITSRYGNGDNLAKELSPILEKASKEIKFSDENNISVNVYSLFSLNEYSLFYAYTLSIIKLGAPSGMKFIFDRLESQKNITIEYKYSNSLLPNILVNGEKPDGTIFVPELYHLQEFRNTDSVPVLEGYLDNDDIEKVSLFGAVYALMKAGQPEGTESVLKWAANREDDVSPLLDFVIPLIRDSRSEKLLKYYAMEEESKTFKNSKNKESVLKGYNKLTSSRIDVEIIKT
ncbi:hypothetical protein FJZ22_02215 [Candidatus Pacearchaeota archaeon]|nr:hypothetical protein [Candidatus Pacearchaeota archaeon]